MRKVSFLFVIALSFTACNKTLYNPQVDEKITVAKAQKDIKIGMSSSEIIEIMGSPNIISTDEQRREVWVYDKISTQRAYQNSSGGISIILAGVAGNSGSNVSTQRTLTVIIKFDNNQKVRDVAYHTSSF
ncbi:outer membrane protein assembly factor BamE [Campylobacter sp. IFREMER_LSEM_CL2127]|uniref:outer membrane protein assembly factor BamE domain-containing protein n=1 Tax=Campylobacter TaxID=194 RepID=UPI00057EA38B|nr:MULTISPECIES: outer membrane protein assembly factor BamE [Campylobacter]AJD05793.1 putative SmpA / OmlA family lipoprotein [Campylobacter lari RM16712]EAL5740508.1 outer membrane protein assembly factor BamE [Campylobacter lari]MCR6518829.1 outer membrane protein assembly factor BamE [Campylobacter lari]MCR6528927.1 outer membrane protein assembly factor BamE [Campylobacter lari]MCV3381180.1 outer membrane protein assembly factor BamE [Campylobacter sp. IFREMER_LSEM_CL2127]